MINYWVEFWISARGVLHWPMGFGHVFVRGRRVTGDWHCDMHGNRAISRICRVDRAGQGRAGQGWAGAGQGREIDQVVLTLCQMASG